MATSRHDSADMSAGLVVVRMIRALYKEPAVLALVTVGHKEALRSFR